MFVPGLAQCLLMTALTATAPPPATFASPVRLMEGAQFLGHKRLYPSPVMFDVDRDGQADLVIGDLFGAVTWCRRVNGKWQESQPLLDLEGKPLRFHNW